LTWLKGLNVHKDVVDLRDHYIAAVATLTVPVGRRVQNLSFIYQFKKHIIDFNSHIGKNILPKMSVRATRLHRIISRMIVILVVIAVRIPW
jgi:hypothetical protein